MAKSYMPETEEIPEGNEIGHHGTKDSLQEDDERTILSRMRMQMSRLVAQNPREGVTNGLHPSCQSKSCKSVPSTLNSCNIPSSGIKINLGEMDDLNIY